MVTRADILAYAKENYNTDPERLWAKYPEYEVLRHRKNQKWYAILMDVPGNKADYAACLKARILRENSVEDGRTELLRRVNEHRKPELYPNTVDYYRNTINVNIESDDKYHPGKITDFWRINKLIKAIEYREAGGYPISDEELEKDIEELIGDLRKIK